jgi:hypothetical protein
VGIGGVALLVTIPMRQMRLRVVLDNQWGLQDSREKNEEAALERAESRAESVGPASETTHAHV